ncbi:hypothetical protein FRB94_010281 [Tulasnella sp. JGI-2019a]|nr:hypothetical protein FRB94_010281 [Tulasnella sp. JGI-2019a]KAG9012350.1 hypothetical protein FRB93_001772 [Tulasnella sp. JGI-2019a]
MNPLRERIMHDIADAILDEYDDFDEESTVLLDFACGSGKEAPIPVMGGGQLASHTKEVIGVDVSENMVMQYNTKVANQGIPPTEMYAIRSTLDGSELHNLRAKQIDVIVCVLGYHHFEDIGDVTRRLATLLKQQSGVLIVVDHLRSDEPSQAASSDDNRIPGHCHGNGIVAHPGGFTESEIRDAFTSAPELAMDDFSFRPMITFKKNGNSSSIFLARASRASGRSIA